MIKLSRLIAELALFLQMFLNDVLNNILSIVLQVKGLDLFYFMFLPLGLTCLSLYQRHASFVTIR